MSAEIRRERLLTLGAAIVLLVVGMIIGSACGLARAGGGALIIPGPGGYTCFGISDGERMVGGNCIRD